MTVYIKNNRLSIDTLSLVDETHSILFTIITSKLFREGNLLLGGSNTLSGIGSLLYML